MTLLAENTHVYASKSLILCFTHDFACTNPSYICLSTMEAPIGFLLHQYMFMHTRMDIMLFI